MGGGTWGDFAVVSSLTMPMTNLEANDHFLSYFGAPPTEESYTFDGAYLDEHFTQSVTTEPYASEVIEDGMVWYFKWDVI